MISIIILQVLLDIMIFPLKLFLGILYFSQMFLICKFFFFFFDDDLFLLVQLK